MPKITFIEFNGDSRQVDGTNGESLMKAALNNGVPGIIADCGGSCACATCHVYIDPAWVGRIPVPSVMEKEMIECTMHLQETSRLSCQIEVNDFLEGLVVRIPESQT